MKDFSRAYNPVQENYHLTAWQTTISTVKLPAFSKCNRDNRHETHTMHSVSSSKIKSNKLDKYICHRWKGLIVFCSKGFWREVSPVLFNVPPHIPSAAAEKLCHAKATLLHAVHYICALPTGGIDGTLAEHVTSCTRGDDVTDNGVGNLCPSE